MSIRFITLSAAICVALALSGQERSSILLEDWEFRNDHDTSAVSGWTSVRIPHDWAITGPFDRENDLQELPIYQNGETVPSVKTGRTGGLPYVGKGCYRTTIETGKEEADSTVRHILLFDGAMSEARVFVNGKQTAFWPYGYNAFHCDITDAVNPGENDLCVMLENRPQSSRWYPGAGLYRKVTLMSVPEVHIPVWGTYITTPYAGRDCSCVSVRTEIEGLPEGSAVTLRTVIRNMEGREVAAATDTRRLGHTKAVEQQLTVENPELWSPETPYLYTAHTSVLTGGSIDTDWTGRHKITVTDGTAFQDSIVTRFGIREIGLRPGKGFFLNGVQRKFKGVCLHHDLGPLGAAVSRSAIRHQLEMLKDMGCDAIRTSHNMPAEELVELCDEMGFMLMVESFDEWDVAKCENGYHRFFDEWAEKDMVNMIRHFRNNPSVVMWSIGNEVPSQGQADGYKTAAFLQDICHREDPTRPVTCGMDDFDSVLGNGFAAVLDVPGFNYKVARYPEAYGLLPQGFILGSETASTVSSRGSYHFPVTTGHTMIHPDHQSSSYDVEFCLWSNIPDDDFVADEDYPWCMGQFVWTGFDYLGEPTPYDTDSWPNHSSVFGIIDLASIPKDRFWLYRSIWNTESQTLHVLPHWTWPGREGEKTPVFVYTSYPEAELFVNGRSCGRRTKADGPYGIASGGTGGENAVQAMERCRMMWNDVKYEPGELKVVAYDSEGNIADEKTVRTAGKPYALKAEADRWNSNASGQDGEDLVYVNVSVVDKDGNPVPCDSREVKVDVSGAGYFKAMANGDPTCLEPFHKPQMHLFNGQLTVIVARGQEPGAAKVTVSAPGLRKAVLSLPSEL